MLGNKKVLTTLTPIHRKALAWFEDREGQNIEWPKPLDGLYLLNKAKGIHKPLGWDYALSVRQSLGGPYKDGEVTFLPSGSWIYNYFQEATDPAERDKNYTNRALLRNLEDGVPVAVVRQIKPKPSPRYEVIGLARVESWDCGYFRLAGWPGNLTK